MQITLASARVNAGLKQLDVCKKMNITEKTLIKWEKGEVIPRADKLFQLCELYGCEITDIRLEGGTA